VRLAAIQASLEQLYDVPTAHRVEDFLLLDGEVARTLAAASDSAAPRPEQLLVRQDGDTLELSLVLERAVIERLAADCPRRRLHPGNLQELWHAVEGVSHFLHLIWSADRERAVSRLELELLADIDKFVVAAGLALDQTGHPHVRQLQRMLFSAIRFRDDLEAEERGRYYEANRLAARYCRSLARRFEIHGGDRRLARELRRFRRLSRSDMLHHIRTRDAGPR